MEEVSTTSVGLKTEESVTTRVGAKVEEGITTGVGLKTDEVMTMRGCAKMEEGMTTDVGAKTEEEKTTQEGVSTEEEKTTGVGLKTEEVMTTITTSTDQSSIGPPQCKEWSLGTRAKATYQRSCTKIVLGQVDSQGSQRWPRRKRDTKPRLWGLVRRRSMMRLEMIYDDDDEL